MFYSSKSGTRFLVLILSLACLATAAPAPAREVVPAPPVIDPASAFPGDNVPRLGTPGSCLPGPVGDLADPFVEPGRDPFDQIGGDDVWVMEHDSAYSYDLDIAADGTIYAAISVNHPTTGFEIRIRFSWDNGRSWADWGWITDPDPYTEFLRPCLQVVEGTVSNVYVVYQREITGSGDTDIRLVSAPHGPLSAAWSPEVTVLSQAGINFSSPHFDTDVSSYNSFYMYVVARGDDGGTGADIWFARSSDQGGSFETPYQIASLLVSGRHYHQPKICYGFGNHLHATWGFYSADGSFDESVRYRRANNFANGGIADWDYWVTMTTTTDGYHDEQPLIEAAAAGNEVVLAFVRDEDLGGSAPFVDTSFFVSDDAGASFDPAVQYPDGPYKIGDLLEQPGTGAWILAGADGPHPSIYTANVADLSSWTGPLTFADVSYSGSTTYPPDIAFSSAESQRVAALWTHYPTGGDPHTVYCDAEWRSDPGIPNVEPGFPIAYGPEIIGAPGLVDLDGDGDLEIVYPALMAQVVARHHDGTLVDGWPVTATQRLSTGPVAIGDLNGDDVPEVVAGAENGRVFAYDPDGNLLPGWPVDLGTSAEVFVSIGGLGGPYPRNVVCVSSNRVRYLDMHGGTPPGAVSWSFGAGHEFVAPAAIGDIDLDGIAEVVGAYHTAVFAVEMTSATYDFVVSTGNAASDAPTLGDLDLDSDLEILVPTVDGILHALDHTGVSLGGNFPWASGLSWDLTSAVLAKFRGVSNPEIAFGSENGRVFCLHHDGTAVGGYPVACQIPNHLLGAPVIDRVEGTSSDLIIGSDDHVLRAWDNFGDIVEGWPFYPSGSIGVSPAVADIDLDGGLEVVVFTDTELYVIDVNNPNNSPTATWPMYGHDPQRTGCSDCPEDVTTAVADGNARDGEERVTRVSFAGAWPNPVGASTTFGFAVPGRAVVSLEVFNLRGARVATVWREEIGAGRKMIGWDGRDDGGRRLAGGTYLARLRVVGPGVSSELVRKVVVLR